MKIMILKIIKHPIYNNFLTWFRVHYKISNNNTYTYKIWPLQKKKKKKKKKSHSVCPSKRKKISLNLKISHCFCPNGIFSLTKIWGQNNPCYSIQLTFTTLWENSADNKLFFLFFSPENSFTSSCKLQQISFDIPCKLSPRWQYAWTVKALFPDNKKKTKKQHHLLSAEIFT